MSGYPHQESCPFCQGKTWHTYNYLESRLVDISRYITLDEQNNSTWSEALADILVLTGNAMDTFFRKMSECPNFEDDPNIREIKKPVKKWTINEYRSIYEPYYELSKNQVIVHSVLGRTQTLTPFCDFSKKTPCWWTAYNKVKHEYYDSLQKANLQNVLNCLGGLLILHALHLCSKRYLALRGKIVPKERQEDYHVYLSKELLRSKTGTTIWAGECDITTSVFKFNYRIGKIDIHDPPLIDFKRSS